MQKQNGDSLMELHIPIRLTVDFSHMHCQVGGGKREGKKGGELQSRETIVGQKTLAPGELKQEAYTCVGMCMSILSECTGILQVSSLTVFTKGSSSQM